MKGIAIYKTVFRYIGLIFFIIGILAIMIAFSRPDVDIREASKEIMAVTTLQRLIQSDECLSTGAADIINTSRLDAATLPPRYELPCAFVPSGGYRVKVTDNTAPTDPTKMWEFGYEPQKRGIHVAQAVTLVYPNGNVNPGTLVYNFSYKDSVSDPIPFLVDQAAATYYPGGAGPVRRQYGISTRASFGIVLLGGAIPFLEFSPEKVTITDEDSNSKICAEETFPEEDMRPPKKWCKKLYDGLRIDVREPAEFSKESFAGREKVYWIVTRNRDDGVVELRVVLA